MAQAVAVGLALRNQRGLSSWSCHTRALGTSSPHCVMALGVIPSSFASEAALPASSIACCVFIVLRTLAHLKRNRKAAKPFRWLNSRTWHSATEFWK